MLQRQNTHLLKEEVLGGRESPSSAWAAVNPADAHHTAQLPLPTPKSSVLLKSLGPARTNTEPNR